VKAVAREFADGARKRLLSLTGAGGQPCAIARRPKPRLSVHFAGCLSYA
jgi:hypothetical protein